MSIPVLRNDGTVTMNAGSIKNYGYKSVTVGGPYNQLTPVTIINTGVFFAKGGSIESSTKNSQKGCSINNLGDLSLWGAADVDGIRLNKAIKTKTSIVVLPTLISITIESPLQKSLRLTVASQVFMSSFTDGDVIAQGSSSYSLQKSDMDKIELGNTNLFPK